MAARVIVAVLAFAAIATAQEDILRLADGVVQGEVTTSARVFRGIPYATPPVGSLRWKVDDFIVFLFVLHRFVQDPSPAQPWSGTRDAKRDYPGCIQVCLRVLLLVRGVFRVFCCDFVHFVCLLRFARIAKSLPMHTHAPLHKARIVSHSPSPPLVCPK